MRYDKEHKERTHRHVLSVASERFRRDGLSGVGVASLMKDAGLTHGGFYGHFRSKQALVEAVISEGLEDTLHHLETAATDIESLVSFYLRPAHRENRAQGCAAAALAAEIVRSPRRTRAAFTAKLTRIIAHIRSLLPDHSEDRAQAIFALLVGTLQLSRAVSDPALSDRMLDAGREAVLALARSGGKG
ncbi:MAG: TetR family transcriptional regulator [Verrucomicrobia bacterium 61-8]|nr:TetR/AcrR family transcriptional regulator [Verrucomicrobiota bacterium]OJV17704.1 MAG: TetR family transcriptional regulator [Verrucomicrobia bacterium 61-8]